MLRQSRRASPRRPRPLVLGQPGERCVEVPRMRGARRRVRRRMAHGLYPTRRDRPDDRPRTHRAPRPTTNRPRAARRIRPPVAGRSARARARAEDRRRTSHAAGDRAGHRSLADRSLPPPFPARDTRPRTRMALRDDPRPRARARPRPDHNPDPRRPRRTARPTALPAKTRRPSQDARRARQPDRAHPPPRRRDLETDPARRRAPRHDRRPVPRTTGDRRARRPRMAARVGASPRRPPRDDRHGLPTARAAPRHADRRRPAARYADAHIVDLAPGEATDTTSPTGCSSMQVSPARTCTHISWPSTRQTHHSRHVSDD